MNKLLAQVDTKINRPSIFPSDAALSLGNILGWALRLVFVFAAFIVLFHLIMGALDWIQSGGDKEKVDKARKRITTAVVGLLILFLVIAAVLVIESVFDLGMGFSKNIVIPKFGSPN